VLLAGLTLNLGQPVLQDRGQGAAQEVGDRAAGQGWVECDLGVAMTCSGCDSMLAQGFSWSGRYAEHVWLDSMPALEVPKRRP
jgi:hypothetical protein